MSRNRAREAKARGRRLIAAEISQEADDLITRTATVLAVTQGRCTRVLALEHLIREGAKKILKKSTSGLDKD